MKLLLAGIAFVIGAFAMSPVMDSAEGIFTGVAVATILPIGIMRKDDQPGGGGVIEDQKQLIEKIKGEISEKFNSMLESNADYKTLKTLVDSMKNATTKEELTKVQESIAELGLKLNSMKEDGAQRGRKKTLIDGIVDAFKSIPAETIEKLKKNKSETIALDVKVAGTMTTSNIDAVGTNSIAYELAEYETGLTRIQRRNPFLMQIVNLANTTKMYVQWAEQANADPGTAGNTAEGSAKTQGDFDIVEKSAKVEKITYYIKVSKEMLDDVAFIENEIRTELMETIMLRADAQILTGSGASPELSGIITTATAWSAGNFANTIVDANNFDVLRTAISQITTANFQPTHIIMHPEDVAMMELSKDTNGQYVMPPFIMNGGTVIKGLPVVTNTGMTLGKFLVGDFTKANVRMREGTNITIGYENDDFTKNLVTILGEMRLVAYVKTNHLLAFVYGDFSDAIVDLDPAVT